MTATRVLIGAIGAVLLASLVGCAPASAPAALPDGVEVSVYQSRSDYSAGIIDVRINNGSDAELTLTSARLVTSQFASPTEWNRGTTLAAGATVDLRLDLPEPVCPTPAGAQPSVTIGFETAGGPRTVTVIADDPIETLTKLANDACISFTAGQHATIVAADKVAWTAGARQPARLELRVTPTGVAGQLVIESANATVLLALERDGTTTSSTMPLGTVIDAAAKPSVIPLELVPSRCDPHAVAEDKRGTFFPLVVRATDPDTGAESAGTMFVPVTDDVRVSLYEFVQDYCGY